MFEFKVAVCFYFHDEHFELIAINGKTCNLRVSQSWDIARILISVFWAGNKVTLKYVGVEKWNKMEGRSEKKWEDSTLRHHRDHPTHPLWKASLRHFSGYLLLFLFYPGKLFFVSLIIAHSRSQSGLESSKWKWWEGLHAWYHSNHWTGTESTGRTICSKISLNLP